MSLRRIPTKAELLRLQKLYRTDKRIAEILGNGVTEHLVAYWRRKKGVATYSFPKFSEKEIREVWDRFGDDFHAGLELGISKAAFYNWRRRYKITKKPEALKLEQLSLELYTQDKQSRQRLGTGRQTIVQKILSQRTGEKSLSPDDTVEVEPDLVFALGDTDEIIARFQESGMSYVWNPHRIMLPVDEVFSDDGRESAAMQKRIRDFARMQQIREFFDVGQGSPLQLVIERGLVLPGQLSISSIRRSTALGAIGTLVFSVPGRQVSDIFSSGKIRLTVPETIRVNLAGRMPRGVFARDMGHHVVGQIGIDRAVGMIIEFSGSGIDQMSISERFTLCMQTALTGAVAAICPYDATARRFINNRARRPFTPVLADRNAVYASEFTFDVNRLKPLAVEGGETAKVVPVNELEGVPVQMIYLGGCANGRFEDLKIVADILKGKRISPDVRVFIQPASREIHLEALKKGLIRAFVENGAIIVSPGSPVFNGLQPLLAEGEVGLSTEYVGGICAGNGRLYHVSPATAAVSALAGQVTSPSERVKV